MIKAAKVLLPIFGLGAASGGGLAAYSFSDSLFTTMNPLKTVKAATVLDGKDSEDLKENMKSGQVTLIYESLRSDYGNNECETVVKEADKEEHKKFQNNSCEGWDTNGLEKNKKSIWVKLVDASQVNKALGEWLDTEGSKGFKTNTDQESKKLSSRNSVDETISFQCEKKLINPVGNLKVEVKCFEEVKPLTQALES
ncbi:hypothetical protein [Mycoplasma suis]|uniref:Uncharacterized protein n=2 Tax=Mycoplasma suis TaxID=57372 RepID=F0QQ37_MYCSL|nr:hypothetical protein [Mycoplasma suis]ADX97607.1 hypothetical protein MSU_0063 [Mycoplasma suis str. Illinois]CBZ40142.1 hypothetical protein MSUIS_00490 [Mycoplasma suis KI3806]